MASLCLTKNLRTNTLKNTNFLQFYQVVSAIPKHLATEAKNTVPPECEPYIENSPLFQLDDLTTIHLDQAKTRDLLTIAYLTKKTHMRCQTIRFTNRYLGW